MDNNIMAEWAIKFYENGWNPIPIDTKTNEPKPKVKWSQYKDTPPRRAEIEEWIKQGLYNDGVAQLTGLCHRGKFKGLYLNCADFDNPSVLEKLLAAHSLEELANAGMFCEQHSDNKGKAHIWVLSTKPFPKLSTGYGIEVKSDGMLCNSFPSIHKNGNRYFPIGNSLKIFDDDVQPQTNDHFIKVIDKILDGNYLNGKAKKNTTTVSIDEKWKEGSRNKNLFNYARDTLIKLRDTTPLEVIKAMVHEMNKVQCEPPLTVDEVDNIFNSALNYSSSTTTTTKPAPGEKKPTKRSIFVKKYTAKGTIPLHESVIIGQNRKFVYLDNIKKPQFVDSIERTDDILFPADTFDTQNPIPFIFESEQKFNQYLERAKSETLDTLFVRFETINRKYVDVEDHYHVLLTADMIWTWLQDKFGYTHYNIIIGDNGTGKNSQLLTFKFLGYRVFYIVGATAPNYFTKMGNIEEGQITIAEDEAEDIASDKEKRTIIKNGYASGGSVPKVELEGGRKSDDWLVYCQKWFAMEDLPFKEMKGHLDRSFVLRFTPGSPQYNIKDVIKSAGEPKFKPLYDELIDTRNILFCWRLLHHDNVIPDVKLNVKNRSAEMTSPLVRLFQNSPTAIEKILDALSKFMVERNESKATTFESILYKVVEKLIKEQNSDTTLRNIDIKNYCKIDMDGDDIPDEPNNFWSPLEGVGKVTQTRITNTCKSRFKAKTKFVKLADKSYRALTFDKKNLDRVKSNYEVVDEIKIEKPVTLVTLDTLYSENPTPKTENSDVNIGINLIELAKNNIESYRNSIEWKDDRAIEQGNTLPESVTSVESVTKGGVAVIAESEREKPAVVTEVKCPEPECNYQVEPFFMKVHLEHAHGKPQQLEIRESKPSEYHPHGLTWNEDGELNISQFIKIEGVKLNDQIVYDPDPAEGTITLVNNFLTGHLRTRGREGGQYPYNLIEFIDKMFGKRIPELTTEVCSNKIPGENKNGDCITVDINPDYEPDYVGDGQTLEGIKDDYFERWRCDPPYNEKTAKEMYNCELPSLYKLLEAGARVVKPGSLMFLLCSQNVQSGTIGKGNIKRVGLVHISVVPNNETRILNIYVKLPEEKQDGPKIAH